MATTSRKKKKKAAEISDTEVSAGQHSAKESASRRTHEVFGIVTLASALLVGPSLFSVHTGDGKLMGPFGEAVGSVLNWSLGLSAYLVVLALLSTSLKIFAGALGIAAKPTATPVLWRCRLGLMLALLFGSMTLHLAGRPLQLAGASFGGALGEFLAELSCSLLSTPGSWIVALAGLALAVVLSTDFSWVMTAVRFWRATGRSVEQAPSRLGLLRARLGLAGSWVAEQLAQPHRKTVPDASGTAALPPVVRIDLSGHVPEARKTKRKETKDKTPWDMPASLPSDLEIGLKSRLNAEAPLSADEAATANDCPAAAPRTTALVIHTQASRAQEAGDLPEGQRALGAESFPGASTESEATERKATSRRATPTLSGDALAAGLHPTPTTAPTAPAAAPDADKLADDGGALESAPKQALTIVRQSFESSEQDTPIEDKAVEDPNGDGFVLNGSTYRTPPISLLKLHDTETNEIDAAEIQRQAARLTEALRHYKIFGTVTEVHPGPVVTMYEFVPEPGTRISKIASLSADLAMSLHALRVRIVAPIPGRGAVGIEVPNERRETVSFREIVADKSFLKNKKARLAMALGKTISGAPAVMDLSKMPHLLVAGATGAGKSVSINSMICSLLMRYSPEEVRMIMIDPKILELSGYNGIPHLLLPVVTDPKPANVALKWAVAEMERRYQQLADVGARDIISYNRKAEKKVADADSERQQELPLAGGTIEEARPSKISLVHKSADGSEDRIEEELAIHDEQEPGNDHVARALPMRSPRSTSQEPTLKRMPYLVVIIDEFADLMTVASKEVETSVARLAQKARACGIHLILATQRPSVDVITGLIKANFPSRIAFQVASNHDSKTILNATGAENLLGAGDMLVLDRGAEMRRLHGAYISDEEIQGIIDWLKVQGRPIYNMEILKAPEDEEERGEGQGDEPSDALYDQAVTLVAETRQASISMVQRRLRIGYNRAARLVEQMEREGIVGPPDGVRGREVLIQHHSE